MVSQLVLFELDFTGKGRHIDSLVKLTRWWLSSFSDKLEPFQWAEVASHSYGNPIKADTFTPLSWMKQGSYFIFWTLV